MATHKGYSLSMKLALDMVNEKNTKMSLDDLMFLLVTLRDNAIDDDVYRFLDGILRVGNGE